MWDVGIILYAMLTGRLLYSSPRDPAFEVIAKGGVKLVVNRWVIIVNSGGGGIHVMVVSMAFLRIPFICYIHPNKSNSIPSHPHLYCCLLDRYDKHYGLVLPPTAKSLICQLLHAEPTKRPTVEEVLAHAFLSQ